MQDISDPHDAQAFRTQGYDLSVGIRICKKNARAGDLGRGSGNTAYESYRIGFIARIKL